MSGRKTGCKETLTLHHSDMKMIIPSGKNWMRRLLFGGILAGSRLSRDGWLLHIHVSAFALKGCLLRVTSFHCHLKYVIPRGSCLQEVLLNKQKEGSMKEKTE